MRLCRLMRRAVSQSDWTGIAQSRKRYSVRPVVIMMAMEMAMAMQLPDERVHVWLPVRSRHSLSLSVGSDCLLSCCVQLSFLTRSLLLSSVLINSNDYQH